MKIIIAPNAFKGSLAADEVAEAINIGVLEVYPDAETVLLPIADGGDGTLPLILRATGGKSIEVDVRDPLGRPISAPFGILPDGTAVIEMAAASGLRLLSRDELNPMKTTTYGTGQLIKAALDAGCRKIIVGVGGSATVDGGAGMAQALGARLLDENEDDIAYGGEGLSRLARIDLGRLDPRIKQVEIIVACDVENPLLGPQGAAAVFGPQKGATPEMVTLLERYLTRYAEIIARDLKKQVAAVPSTGAAGGLCAGLVAFLDAKIELGAQVILNLMDFESHLHDADLVITGEGQIDSQTAFGKGPAAAAQFAKKYDVPVIALAGGLAEDAYVVYEHGIDALVAIVPRPMSLDDALKNSYDLVRNAAVRAMRMIKIGQGIRE